MTDRDWQTLIKGSTPPWFFFPWGDIINLNACFAQYKSTVRVQWISTRLEKKRRIFMVWFFFTGMVAVLTAVRVLFFYLRLPTNENCNIIRLPNDQYVRRIPLCGYKSSHDTLLQLQLVQYFYAFMGYSADNSTEHYTLHSKHKLPLILLIFTCQRYNIYAPLPYIHH